MTVALLAAAACSLLALGTRAVADRGGRHAARHPHKVWPRDVYPPPGSVRRAQSYAAARGDVSFAVMDRSLGLRGYDDDRQFSSASVSKALLLAAELRRLESEGLPLDDETKALLEPMITYSDNRAADAIYARVGDEGLEEVAERAGMNDFDPTPGFWGGDRITAADMARFFYGLDRQPAGPAPRLRPSGCWRGSRRSSAGGFPRRSVTAGRSGSREAGDRPAERRTAGRSPTRPRCSSTAAESGWRSPSSPTRLPGAAAASRRSREWRAGCSHPRRLTAAAGRSPD